MATPVKWYGTTGTTATHSSSASIDNDLSTTAPGTGSATEEVRKNNNELTHSWTGDAAASWFGWVDDGDISVDLSAFPSGLSLYSANFADRYLAAVDGAGGFDDTVNMGGDTTPWGWSSTTGTGIKTRTYVDGSFDTTDVNSRPEFTLMVLNSDSKNNLSVTVDYSSNDTWCEITPVPGKPVLVCGAECGVDAAGAAAAVDSHWSSVANTPAIVTSPVRTGDYAYQFSNTTFEYVRKQWTAAGELPQVLYARLYFRVPSTTPTSEFALLYDSSADCQLVINTSGVLRCVANGTYSSTNDVTLSADTWYGVEIEWNKFVGAKWRVWTESGGWTTSETISNTGTYVGYFTSIGMATDPGGSFTVYMDDIVLGIANEAGELYDDTSTNGVDGHVLNMVPASDGTHSFTTGYFTDESGDLAPTDTDIYTSIDDGILTNQTTWVQWESNNNDYYECLFEDESDYDDPRGVMLTTAFRATVSTEITYNVRVSDNSFTDYTDSVGNGENLSTSSTSYHVTPLVSAPSGSAWTRTLLNAMKMRGVGAGGNAVGARMYDLALEVEWTTAPAGATPVSVSGSVTPTGALDTSQDKVATGAVTPAGTLLLDVTQTVAGAITPAGDVANLPAILLAGALTPSGAITTSRYRITSVAGSVTPTGALLNDPTQTLAGSVTPDGDVLSAVSQLLDGSVTPSGDLAQVVAQLLAGALAPAGDVANLRARLVSVAGAITPSGALANMLQQLLEGSLTPDGALSQDVSQLLAGAITPAGSVSNQTSGGVSQVSVSGSVTPTGALLQAATQSLAGSLTPSGALANIAAQLLSGSITPSAELTNTMQLLAAGSLTPAGDESNLPSILPAGTVTPAGTHAAAVAQLLAGALTPAGALTQTPMILLAGSVTPSGTHDGQVFSGVYPVSVAGAVTPAGALLQMPSLTHVGQLEPGGTHQSGVQLHFDGSVASAGVVARLVGIAPSGSVTPSGDVSSLRDRLVSVAGTVAPDGTLVSVPGILLDGSIAPDGTLIDQPQILLFGAVTPQGSHSYILPGAGWDGIVGGYVRALGWRGGGATDLRWYGGDVRRLGWRGKA